MKIEGNHGRVDCNAIRPEAPAAGRGKAATAAASGGDRVNLSVGVGAVQDLVRVASAAPDVRADAVERARQKLVAGVLGNDLLALADRLIDHMIGPR
ncbi:MAG: flagellar biosynthesis anti-sigma factor FlgM [Acidobacteria bacterium]|nr:MAG: flagellar biosynthesis anti-sigma factor FlgM [Acidobacteriota bacterium]